MAQKRVIYFLTSLIISTSCMVIQRAPIPVFLRTQYNDDPIYSFAYDVNDRQTGDIKNQRETRRGDIVTGEYSLIQPDGVRRTVEYHADNLHGFQAILSNIRLEEKPNEGVRATNNRQWSSDTGSEELVTIDPRFNLSPRQWLRVNIPAEQWQTEFSNTTNKNTETPRGQGQEFSTQTQRPVENKRTEVQGPPIATSRTSIIQRVENSQPVLVASIPWV